eukprot:361840-Chlamydomonas_euryale.AAC.11
MLLIGTCALSSGRYSASSSCSTCTCASTRLLLTGLNRMACVLGFGRYSRMRDTADASGPVMPSFTRPTISASLAGAANACSRIGRAALGLACAATRTAVTLVMKPSSGSTAALHAWASGSQHAHDRVGARHAEERRLAGENARHVVAHVREVEVDISRRKLDVKRRNLFAQQQQVARREKLRVERARALEQRSGGRLDRLRARRDCLLRKPTEDLGVDRAVQLGQA